MEVRLPPELEQFVDDEVKSGNFVSRDEVIEPAVARLMLDPRGASLDPETLHTIEEAEEQFDRGDGIPLDEAFALLRKKHLGR
jgi:Arc/MetJ-type ribon-helix-helix transcriptional regulator